VIGISFRPRSPLRRLFSSTKREQYVERYILREHAKGRRLAEILEDPYVRAWSTPQERLRLLERPGLVEAIGEQALGELRASAAGSEAPAGGAS